MSRNDEFRSIPAWPEYRLSPDGQVLSVARRLRRGGHGRVQTVPERMLKPVPTGDGGHVVTLSRPPKPGVRHRRTVAISTLLRETFGAAIHFANKHSH
jgi:hypothetical protein